MGRSVADFWGGFLVPDGEALRAVGHQKTPPTKICHRTPIVPVCRRVLRSSANRTIFYRVLTSMEKLFITPKRKSSYRSDLRPSPEDKRLKESNSPAKISSDEDRVMEALEPKIDLVLSKLSNVEAKMEELNVAAKGLQSKVTSLEIEVDSVKTIQKALDDNFTSLERNTVFVDEQVQELTAKTYKNSNDVSDTRRKLLYLEAYSRRENLKFEGIPETFVTSEEDGAIQRGEVSTENTKAVLTEFLQRVLGIEDVQSTEYQRVHRMGKPRKENGRERIIIARFLRFSDRERVFKCGRKLKDTEYKMYEDLPKEIHEKRKLQMEKLKSARRDGKRAYFSRSEPDKPHINGKHVEM